MADNIKVRIKAQAYERSHPKTSLSEFENDTGFATKEELLEEIYQLRQWILQNVATGGTGGQPISGGNISGGDVAYRELSSISDRISANDVTLRVTAPIRLYFYGGDIKNKIEGL